MNDLVAHPLKIIFAGTPIISANVLTKLISSGVKFAAVLTQIDRRAGRGNKVQPSAVKQLALQNGLDIIQIESFKNPESLATIARISPDLIIVVAYGLILPQELLNIPRLGCINMHVSLLPKYRGAAPIQWAILNGDSQTGVTIMQIDKGLDTGDILLQQAIEITRQDTSVSLAEKMVNIGSNLLLEYLNNINNIKAHAQGQIGASYAAKITKDQAQIKWSNSAYQLSNQIRALNPNPGCYCYLDGTLLKLWVALDLPKATATANNKPIGTIIASTYKGIEVICGEDSILCITQLQLAGKKQQSAEVFALGISNLVGKILT